MGFFDSVLEEAPKVATVFPSVTKKDEQDGSFLIIDDSVSVHNLPDTALQIFDATPEVHSALEISFFSDSGISLGESSENVGETIESASAEIAFFEEPVETNEDSSILQANSESDRVVSFMGEPTAEVSEESIPTISPEKNDIYAPLKRAIAEYDTILAMHAQIAAVKDSEIMEFNAQIAEAKEVAKRAIDAAKESSKKALEERKDLETGMDEVRRMKNVLSLQLK